MGFPTRFTVTHFPFEGQFRDAHGNAEPSWGAGITRGVYGWQPDTASDGDDSRVVADLLLLAPVFPVRSRDRFEVPHEGVLEVPESRRDYTNGPFDYQPGMSVPLRRVEG